MKWFWKDYRNAKIRRRFNKDKKYGNIYEGSFKDSKLNGYRYFKWKKGYKYWGNYFSPNYMNLGIIN